MGESGPGGSPNFLGGLQIFGGFSKFLGGLQFFGGGGGSPNFWGVSNFSGGSPIFFGVLQIFGEFSKFSGGLQFFGGGVSTGTRSTFGRYASYWNAFLLI